MAQKKIKIYRCSEWDCSCSKAEDFLNGLRNDFMDKGYADVLLADYASKAIRMHVSDQDVLLYERKLAAMFGAMVAFNMTGKTIVKHIIYDAVMNLWSYMDNIYKKVYVELSSDREREEFLRKKRWEFILWYSINSKYDVSAFHNVLNKISELTMQMIFEPEQYTRPVILMAYISIKVEITC